MYQAGIFNNQAKAAVFNGLLFNVTWFFIVYTHSLLWAPVFAALHLTLHFAVFGWNASEMRLVASVTVLGFIIDQSLLSSGVLRSGGYPTIWLSCIWPVLATTLLHAFSGLRNRLPLASLMGAIGGGLSYTAGVKMTPIAYGWPEYGPLIMAVIWSVLFPLLLWAASRVQHRESLYELS